MTGCNKYVVINLDNIPTSEFTLTLAEWLNNMCESGLELVAVRGNEFIFKRNIYIKSIEHVEDYQVERIE